MKYTGTLKKGITRRRVGLLADSDAHKIEGKRIADEMFAKLPELFRAYGIKPNNWPAMVLALAQEHVPGFKVINPAGRKIEWGDADNAEFRLDVDAIVADSGNTVPVTEAIKLACRLDAWASKTRPMTLAAITAHYYDADLRWVEIAKDARAYESIVPTN